MPLLSAIRGVRSANLAEGFATGGRETSCEVPLTDRPDDRDCSASGDRCKQMVAMNVVDGKWNQALRALRYALLQSFVPLQIATRYSRFLFSFLFYIYILSFFFS